MPNLCLIGVGPIYECPLIWARPVVKSSSLDLTTPEYMVMCGLVAAQLINLNSSKQYVLLSYRFLENLYPNRVGPTVNSSCIKYMNKYFKKNTQLPHAIN